MREYEFDVSEEPTIDNALIQTQILMMGRKIVEHIRERGCRIYVRKTARIEDIFDPEEIGFFHLFKNEILSEFGHHMASSNYFSNDPNKDIWYNENNHCIHMDLFYDVPTKVKQKYTLINDIATNFCALCFISFCVFIFDFIFTVCMGFDVSRTVELVRIVSAGLTIFSLFSAMFFCNKSNKYDDAWEPEIAKHFAATGVKKAGEE